MKTEIVFVRSLKEEVDTTEFFTRVFARPELLNHFLIARMGAPAIREVLREWITENGISSLFNFHINCDAVLHPGITVDEIEELILAFVGKLKGMKNLFIIDPYFYSSEPAVVALFEKMMMQVAAPLESVTFFSKRRPSSERVAMHTVLANLKPSVKIKDVETNAFHDRYWIDPDGKKGLVMGTSLNGVTKKIALIDHLGSADAAQLAAMAQALL